MPIWMAKLMAVFTRNDDMKFAANLLGYFNQTPEVGNTAEANALLRAPTTTLDSWMESKNKEK